MTHIFYHDDCMDGLLAAYTLDQKFGGQCHPTDYGTIPKWNLIEDEEVYLVDFSYSREHLQQADKLADQLVVLDHHKTAQKACQGLEFCTFDMDRSGCMLAWDYCYKGAPPPLWRYVQDRDLWRFELPQSKAINTALRSYPWTFDQLSEWTPQDFWTQEADGKDGRLAKEGQAMLRYQRRLIDQIIDQNGYPGKWLGYEAMTVNAARPLRSELGAAVCSRGYDLAVIWSVIDETGRFRVSLRSDGDVDCANIAESFGGGGHAEAARFTSPHNPEGLLYVRS